jgi:hypothetical protein
LLFQIKFDQEIDTPFSKADPILNNVKTEFIYSMFKNSFVVFQCEFIGKNNDALHSDLEAVLHTSQDNFLKSLFPNKQEADNFLLPTKKKLAFDSIGSKFKVEFFSSCTI